MQKFQFSQKQTRCTFCCTGSAGHVTFFFLHVGIWERIQHFGCVKSIYNTSSQHTVWMATLPKTRCSISTTGFAVFLVEGDFLIVILCKCLEYCIAFHSLFACVFYLIFFIFIINMKVYSLKYSQHPIMLTFVRHHSFTVLIILYVVSLAMSIFITRVYSCVKHMVDSFIP